MAHVGIFTLIELITWGLSYLKWYFPCLHLFIVIHHNNETVDLLISVWMLFVSSSVCAVQLFGFAIYTHTHTYTQTANHHSICLIHFIVIYTLIIMRYTWFTIVFTHILITFFFFLSIISSVGFIRCSGYAIYRCIATTKFVLKVHVCI